MSKFGQVRIVRDAAALTGTVDLLKPIYESTVNTEMSDCVTDWLWLHKMDEWKLFRVPNTIHSRNYQKYDQYVPRDTRNNDDTHVSSAR